VTIGQIIKQLLEERKRVIFPGFGNLEVKESGGSIPSNGKRIDPPGLIVKFDSSYSKDDGVLADAFADAAGLEHEESRQQVLELVDAIRFALDKGETYHLASAGIFKRDDEGKIYFRPEASWVLEPDQYGLDSMDLLELEDLPLEDLPPESGSEPTSEQAEDSDEETIERAALEFEDEPATESGEEAETGSEKQTEDDSGVKVPSEPAHIPTPGPITRPQHSYEQDTTHKRARLWRIIWIVTGVLIVILVVVILVPADSGGIFGKKKREQPVQTVQPAIQPELKDQSSITEPVTESDSQAETEQIEPPVQEPDLFFIIAGSFKHLAYASELQDKLKTAGYPAEVMITENRMYRVSVGSYSDKSEAESNLARMKSQPGLESCWLLSNE